MRLFYSCIVQSHAPHCDALTMRLFYHEEVKKKKNRIPLQSTLYTNDFRVPTPPPPLPGHLFKSLKKKPELMQSVK